MLVIGLLWYVFVRVPPVNYIFSFTRQSKHTAYSQYMILYMVLEDGIPGIYTSYIGLTGVLDVSQHIT